jgi:peptide/nickel transport system substrate-binding protein
MALVFGAAPSLADDCGTIVVPPGIGIGPGADVTSFNPLLVDSLYNAEAADLLFAQLIWVNRFHRIDYGRSIASSVTTPDNGKTYEIAMRPWHWSDGEAVTSIDVAYTLKLLHMLGATSPYYGQGGMPDIISHFDILDAEHFRITLAERVNPEWFILNGLPALAPMPEHVWGRYSLDQLWQNQSTPAFFSVVDGPLLLHRFVVGQEAVFVPNPRYDGPKLHFHRFVIQFMNSEGMALQAVQAHTVDIANLPFALWGAAQHLAGLHVVALPPSYSWQQFIPNLRNPHTPFFADTRIRDAMADAIDQREMIRLAMHGHGDPVYNAIPPDPARFLSPSARVGNFPISYNPETATALLRTAGYTPGPDGVMQKNGQRLEFTLLVPANQTMRLEMAEVAQQNLRAVGIEMKAKQVEFNQILALDVGPPEGWEAIFFAQDMSPYPTGETLFKTGGFYNTNGYRDARMDQLIDQSTHNPGLTGLFAYQDYASQQQPVIFLPVGAYAVLVRNGLHGVKDFLNPLGLWAPDALSCTGPSS